MQKYKTTNFLLTTASVMALTLCMSGMASEAHAQFGGAVSNSDVGNAPSLNSDSSVGVSNDTNPISIASTSSGSWSEWTNVGSIPTCYYEPWSGGGGDNGDNGGSNGGWDADGDGVPDNNQGIGSWENGDPENQWSQEELSIMEEKHNESNGGGGGGKVLCTYFHHKGWIDDAIYRADSEYARLHVSENTKNGYHRWAVPMVKWLQEKERPIAEKFIFIWVNAWAHQMAYDMGVIEKRSYIGTFLKTFGEPLCNFIGRFSKETNYMELWKGI